MTDIGPSLAKLRRDWREDGAAEVPAGMIARRVTLGAMDALAVGEKLTVERVGVPTFRVSRA